MAQRCCASRVQWAQSTTACVTCPNERTRTCSGGCRRYLPPPALQARLVPRTFGLASCSSSSGGAADAAWRCAAAALRLQEPCMVQNDHVAKAETRHG